MPTLNRFVGAEMGGLEEASAVGAAWSVSTVNTSILVNDVYHFHGEGTGTILSLGFDMDAYVAFENNNLIVSFALEFTAWPATDSEIIVSLGNDIEIAVSTTGTLTLQDSNSGSLDTYAASLNTLYEIEIYFQRANASGAWEWRINGTSQGLGTGADLLDASSNANLNFFVQDSAIVMDVNNIVVRSGCTTSDWLGTGISVCALATPAGTPTIGGDALSSGGMANTQVIPLDSAEAQFDAGTARSRWIQSDGGTYLPSRIYYFDASDAGPTDNEAVWANDANAFDGNRSTGATTITVGTETSNELRGEGTNAPAGETVPIVSVKARMYCDSGSFGDYLNYAIYSDGGSELLATDDTGVINTLAWTGYVTLTTPTGGWTWAKVAALEVVVWRTGAGTPLDGDLRVVQVAVATDEAQTPTDYGLTNTIACKLLMDS